MRHPLLLLLASTVLLSSALTGCGQKGPLTLPAKPVEATTPAPVAKPVDATTDPSAAEPDAGGAGSTGKDDKQGRPHVA